MDDAPLVGGVERVGELSRDGEDLFQWKHAEGDPVRQRGPLDQFEDERQRAT